MGPFAGFFQNVGNALHAGAQAIGNTAGNVERAMSSAVTPKPAQPTPVAPKMVAQMFQNKPAPAAPAPMPQPAAPLAGAPTNPNSNQVTGDQVVNGIYDQIASALGTPITVAKALLNAPRNPAGTKGHGTKENGAISESMSKIAQGLNDPFNSGLATTPNGTDPFIATGQFLGSEMMRGGGDAGAVPGKVPAATDFTAAKAGQLADETRTNVAATSGGAQAGFIRPLQEPAAPPAGNPVAGASTGDQVQFSGGNPAFGNRTPAEIKAQAGAMPIKANLVPRPPVPPAEAMPPTSAEPPVTPGAVFQQNGIQREALPTGTEPPVSEPSAQQASPAGEPGAQPWQEFSQQQKEYEPGADQKAVRQISPKSFVKENDPVGTVNSVHETLDRYGITNPTAEEQLKVLPAIRTSIYKTAQGKIAADPDVAPLSTVEANINSELASQTRLKDISAPAAKDAIEAYTQNLYNEAMNTTNQVVPTTIPYKTLLDMKTIANKDYSKIVQKNLNNQPLTDTEKVNAAYRNGLDKTITARYPGVKQDTMDMSNLYKAQAPLASAIPKYEAPPPVVPPPTGWQRAANIAKTAAYSGGGLLFAADAAKNLGINVAPAGNMLAGMVTHGISDFFAHKGSATNGNGNKDQSGQAGQDVNNHGYSLAQFDPQIKDPTHLPTNSSQITPTANGTFGIANIYSWKDSTGAPLYTSPQVIETEQKTLSTLKGQLAAAGGHDTELEGRIATLSGTISAQQQFSGDPKDPKSINGMFIATNNANVLYNKAIVDAKAANLDISNFNGSYNDLMNHVQNTNAKLFSDLKTLQQKGLISGDAPVSGTLTAFLQEGAANNLQDFYSTLAPQSGYTGQGSTGTQQAPPAPTSVPITGESSGGAPGFAGGVPGAGGSMPSFSGGAPAIPMQ